MSVKPESSQVSQFATMIGYFAIVAGVAFAGTYTFFALQRRRRIARPQPDASIRLRASSGVYRARYVGETSEGWILSAPIQRDAYVPLRPGEGIVAECPTDRGVLLFRSRIVSRDADTHMIVIEKPRSLEATERRTNKRMAVDSIQIGLDDFSAKLLDISEGGAKAIVSHRFANGERVSVKLPWKDEPVYAAVLETQYEDGRGTYSTRLVFEETIPVKWSGLQFAVEA